MSIWCVNISGHQLCHTPNLEILHCSEGEIGKVLSSSGLSIWQRAENARVPRGGMFPTEREAKCTIGTRATSMHTHGGDASERRHVQAFNCYECYRV